MSFGINTIRPGDSFAQRLKALREKAGYSQSELARQLFGSSKSSQGYIVANKRERISSWEAGNSVPTRKNTEKLASFFGVPPYYLNPSLKSGHESTVKPLGGGVSEINIKRVVPDEVAQKIEALLAGVQV